MSDKARAKLMLEAQRKGWVKLLGATDGNLSDVVSLIKEHFGTEDEPVTKLRLKRGKDDGC